MLGWAFSAVQNIESQYFLNGNNLTQLSVEQVVDCDGSEDDKDDEADCGVFGGWPFLEIEYVKKALSSYIYFNYGHNIFHQSSLSRWKP